jgi:hypothetical protein
MSIEFPARLGSFKKNTISLFDERDNMHIAMDTENDNLWVLSYRMGKIIDFLAGANYSFDFFDGNASLAFQNFVLFRVPTDLQTYSLLQLQFFSKFGWKLF